MQYEHCCRYAFVQYATEAEARNAVLAEDQRVYATQPIGNHSYKFAFYFLSALGVFSKMHIFADRFADLAFSAAAYRARFMA